MFKNVALAALAATCLAGVANAAVLVPGAPPVAFTDPFVGPEGTQIVGTFQSQTLISATFTGTLTSAVYRNADDTLDFYYQVARTGPGTAASHDIAGFTTTDFEGFTVDARVLTSAGNGFVAPNNPPPAGDPAGSTTTVDLTLGGAVQVNFGRNALAGTENSVTYVLRTNATNYNFPGFTTVYDGASANATTFQPTAVVPEPATWAMLVGGFGLVGASMRRSRRIKTVLA